MYVLNNWAVELSSNCAQRRLWKFMGDLVAQPSVWTFDLQNWTMYPVCILSAHVVYSTYQVACNIFFPILVHVVAKKHARRSCVLPTLLLMYLVHVFWSADTLNTRRAHKKPNLSRELLLIEAPCTDTACISPNVLYTAQMSLRLLRIISCRNCGACDVAKARWRFM